MKSSSISEVPHPHRQAISLTEKLGVIMSAMKTPTARMKVLLDNISQFHSTISHRLPAVSSSLRPNGRQANWLIWRQPIRTASPELEGLPFRIALI